MGYKGKTCVYCGQEGASSTADHVLAREFVLVKSRDRLPKVPACAACNRLKAHLEDYLTKVLPVGGRNAEAREHITTLLPKRLKGSPRLRDQMLQRLEPRWLPEPSGLLVRTSSIEIDAEKLDLWCVALVKGLTWHHWGEIIAGACNFQIQPLTPQCETDLLPIFHLPAHKRIEQTSIGGDTLVYEAAQDPNLAAVWRLIINGGMVLGGDDSRLRSNVIWVWVRPRSDPGHDLPTHHS